MTFDSFDDFYKIFEPAAKASYTHVRVHCSTSVESYNSSKYLNNFII